MTRLEPRIYTLDTTTIIKRYQNLEHIFPKKDALQTLILNPKILTYTIENINDKLNINNLILNSPSILMQSYRLTYVRSRFLKSKKIPVTGNNLFSSEQRFVNKYKITKEEMFNKYPLEDKNKVKVKKKVN